MIETKGLVAVIESLDAMLKAADVILTERTFVGAGLVMIAVSGEVAAVKAAVAAGAAAAQRVGEIVSTHVIACPDNSLKEIVGNGWAMPQMPPAAFSSSADCKSQLLHNPANAAESWTAKAPTPDFELILTEMKEKGDLDGIEKLLLSTPVGKLRHLARRYPELEITGREISVANKEQLIRNLMSYFRT